MPKGARRGKSDGHGHRHDKKHGKAARQAAKRQGKSAYLNPSDPQIKLFASRLEALRLRLHDVPGDGNCLFRALADQLDNGSTSHETVRSTVVQYIRQHEAEFSPFLEEGASFDDYITELNKDGEYGGNDAIVAFARHYTMDVLIHQLDLPLWEVRVPGARRQAQIAYLNGEHYCSVRPLLERNPPEVPPACTEVPGDCDVQRGKVAGRKSEKLENLLEATSCTDLGLAQQCLEESGYDIDAAIVELLQLMDLGATEHLHSYPTAADTGALDKDECMSKGGRGAVQRVDTTAAGSKRITSGISAKRLQKEAKAARKGRRAEEQHQSVHKRVLTDAEPPEGSICI